MSAPDTRGSGAWQTVKFSEKVVNQTFPNASDRLIALRKKLCELKEHLEKKENAARYIREFLIFNESDAPTGDMEKLLREIGTDVKATKVQVGAVEKEITSLSINFDRLATRVETTEHKLGVTPSAETMLLPTYKVRPLVDKRSPESVAALGQEAGASSTPVAVSGDEEKSEERPPLVFYKGGLDGESMPTPHLDDLTAFLKKNEGLQKRLRGLGQEQPKKVGGVKPTKEQEAEYKRREDLLLNKLSETNTNMVKMLEQGRGGEGRVNRLIKQKFREISRDQGYPVNPRTRRVHDVVDGDTLCDINLNWHLNTKNKEIFEKHLRERDLSAWSEDGDRARALLVTYHVHKITLGDFTMPEWREYDTMYGLDARPVYLPILVENHLEAKAGLTLGQIKKLGIIEITPQLSGFSARFPHTLVLTVLNAELAEELVNKHRDTIRITTTKERKKAFYRLQYYLPDETQDRVKRLEARQEQLRKSNEFKGLKRTNFSYTWDTERMDLQMDMSVDDGPWTKVDTSSTRSPLISTRNEWRGKIDNLRMSNHHLRMLMQFRYSATGRTATGKRKQLQPLTDEQFAAASISAERAEEIRRKKVETEKAETAAKAGASGGPPLTPSFLSYRPTSPGVTPGKHGRDSDDEADVESQQVQQKTKTDGVIKPPSLLAPPGAFSFIGKPPGKSNSENLVTNSRFSILRASESSDDDDFEDAAEFVQARSEEVSLPSKPSTSKGRSPSIFDSNFETYDLVNVNVPIDNSVNRNSETTQSMSRSSSNGTAPELPQSRGTGEHVLFENVDKLCEDPCKSRASVSVNVDVGVSDEVSKVNTVNNSVIIVSDKSVSSVMVTGRDDETKSDITVPSQAVTAQGTPSDRGEPSKTLQNPVRDRTMVSPLRANHEVPKLKLQFDRDATGKSIVFITMNKTMMSTWLQFWSSIEVGDVFECEHHFIELKAVKNHKTELHLGIKMKTKTKGNNSQVTVFKLSSTELRMESKKGYLDASSMLGKVLKPMLWSPFESLSDNQQCTLDIIREEGDRKCRVCAGEQVDLYRCSCCHQYVHKKCLEKATCKGLCRGLQVTLNCDNRKDLVVDNLDSSVFYRRILEAMKRGCVGVSKAELVRRNEGVIEALIEANRRPEEEAPDPVVVNRTKRLESIANENVAAEEARCLVKGDTSKTWAVGKSLAVKGKANEKTKEKPLSVTEILAKTSANFTPEVSANKEVCELIRLNLNRDVCTDAADPAGSWLRAVSTASIRDGDLDLPSAVNHLRDTLISNIPHLGETGRWVDAYFGGDHSRYVKYVRDNISPSELSEKGMMICAATAKVLRREIILYVAEDLSDPRRLPAGPEASQDPLKILFCEGRFWAMVPVNLEILGEVRGMEEQQSQASGKYKHHKKKGPTLAVKPRPVTKSKKDELRRRDEKAKSEREVRVDALQAIIDSLKCDTGELRDKMRNMESREKTQNQYIASLERKFVHLCPDCKKKDVSDTAFTPEERYSISRILELLERQEERHATVAGNRMNAPASAPVTGTQAECDSL